MRKSRTKKLVSMFLCMAMLLTSFGTNVFAEEVDTDKPVVEGVWIERNPESTVENELIDCYVKAYDNVGIGKIEFEYSTIGDKCVQIMSVETKSEDNIYKYTIILENPQKCNFILHKVDVYDITGNSVPYACKEKNIVEIEGVGVREPKLTRFEIADKESVHKAEDLKNLISFDVDADHEKLYNEKLILGFTSKSNKNILNLEYYYDKIDGYKYNHLTGGNTMDETDEFELSSISLTSNTSVYNFDISSITDKTVKILPEEKQVKKEIKIDSIDLLVNNESVIGKEVAAGDEIKVVAKPSEESPVVESIVAKFVARMDDKHEHKEVDASLHYVETSKSYEGTLVFNKNNPPREFYLIDVWCSDDADVVFDNNNQPYYVNLVIDGKFVEDLINRDVYVIFDVTGNDGYGKQIAKYSLKGKPVRGSLKEWGIKYPENPKDVAGAKFVEWNIKEDTVLKADPYMNIDVYAIYDKNITTVDCCYLNSKNESSWFSKAICFDDKATDDEIKKIVIDNLPADVSKDYANMEYEFDIYRDENNKIIDVMCSFIIPDKNVDVILYMYVNKYGMADSIEITYIVDKDADIDEVIKQTVVPYPDDGYKGLDFVVWRPDERYNVFKAVYKQKAVCYELHDISNNSDLSKIIIDVFNPGEEITFRDEFEGWTGLEKLSYENKKNEALEQLKEDSFVRIWLDMSSDGTNVTVKKELEYDEVNRIVNDILNAKKDDVVKVDMKDATVVPSRVLENIKGKDVTVELNMGGYTWTINGKDVKASDLKDIDLEVTVGSNKIPTKTIKRLAGNDPVKQLSLSHNGDFGFTAKLTVNVGKEYVNKNGHLYYYDSDNKLVYMNSGVIDENGNVSLKFSHASEYAIVISERAANEINNNTDKKTNNKAVPLTGDDFNAVPYMAAMLMCLAAVAVVSKKRTK